ncbi:MAG: transposase [Pedosphaera sp.]|nr:transposase [Pedosphaera sp.]
MHCRRLSSLTNAFSKKVENFEAAVALNFAYYKFVETHGALKMTPPWPLASPPTIGSLKNW